ncbi:MAG: hypothetical protein QG675_24 [Patescibacteria group bacterium]|jgi:hypothetical protein|nr:hypothetical protein [Patescibacteria group bacterium]
MYQNILFIQDELASVALAYQALLDKYKYLINTR